MKGYRFDFCPYERRFLQPLVTRHGTWHTREGIIIRLGDAKGKCGWGEIAPMSWFGSETLEQALNFCDQLPTEITEEIIFSIPDHLPASQFGFESALVAVGIAGYKRYSSPLTHGKLLTYSGLLPAGEAALNQWETLWKQGYRTFKWKIGVNAIAQELEIFDLLTRTLPTSAKLRLDANGGLSYQEANRWLEICEHIQANVEFIEQPLPVEQFSGMLKLSADFKTAIALDESVATFKQLEQCFQQGWRGIFVIKPGIAGSPFRLRQFCQSHKIDVVFSSVFETAIGKQAALQLAAELSRGNRAVGFGINHFLENPEENLFKCP
ncbi:o-succinylbenzoate synthase [Umezakia ovalisporum]|jgi:O-succinylbenzoate synthase|uniref:o-succinylbenzoate synthase n=2 Tax=Umezakia ovalisporum TaxID=75695 RepID=A0AA43GVU7_9CYAN|nr:o-succinylbenzoate synthase [Umezakia ovalisporum]MBI1243030.1 o-succinylbenzoate synthase [Nostoc sp. RI_552]MDH6055694.1 o-succinylbenzoate synthase [Umezakia ovalisporum FSS-43]MDH6062356.1 o-succinylbenzoate synthase [Umezakia ovalisporum FSS-62]MDH6068235.1 o-succinylbenzoate synthase [Umezakia ovalisporum APH033B]MDH6069363.1 o-succinylbenzoate synthase [Umezakia ovalisporum CobakiLakeA]